MSWLITGSEKTPVDPQFGSVSLLLHGDGANNSTAIVDSSPNAVAVTRAGSTLPVISTAQSKYGGSSILIGSTIAVGYLDLPASGLFSFPSDFTFEAWFFATNLPTGFRQTVIELGGNAGFSTGMVLRADGAGTSWSFTVGGTTLSGGATALSQWQHIALSRAGNTVRSFLDGTQQATATVSSTINPSILTTRIGEGITVTGRNAIGYIDDLRITKGVARYTANFTPPTAPFPDI